jgi:NAD(P)H-hydrate epimerase
VPAQQYQILDRMALVAGEIFDLPAADLVIDAMIGYGLIGNPRGRTAEWIQQVNQAARPVLALDLPSGLEASTGLPGTPCVRAAATMTLALPKTGLFAPQAASVVGDLYLTGIGVPPELYAAPSIGLTVEPIFAHDTLLPLER